jgi:hypothetical protein
MQSLEGQFATTYDAVVTLHGGDMAQFTLWVRASDQTGNDVGCEFDNGELFVAGPGMSGIGQPVGPVGDPATVRIQATVVPVQGMRNVRCFVQIDSNTPAVNTGTMTLSPGNVGFSVYMGKAEITGLVIYDRTIPPPSL